MVPKVTTGAGLRGALNYDFSSKDGAPRAECIGGTLFGTPREMAAQAGALRALRPDCKKPVFRVSLSLPPSDGQLRADQWLSVIEAFKREMGIPETAAWCAIRHTDRDHDHIHFTLLRVLPNGKLWNQEHSAKRAIAACQVIENEFELSSHSREKVGKARPSRAETKIFKRTGVTMNREHIQTVVDGLLNHYDGEPFSFESFKADMSSAGIQVEMYAPKGVFKGVSYTDHKGIRWQGSKIGRDYSAGLIERGLYIEVEDQDRTNAHWTKAVEPVEPLATKPGVSLSLAKPGTVAQNVINHVPGQWSPLLAAVMAFNQLMLQFLAEGLQGLATALAKFVRSFLRLFGFKVAEPAPATVLDSQEMRQARVTVPIPQQFVSNSSDPSVANRAAGAAAATIEKITQMARTRDLAGIKKEIESTVQVAQLSPEVDSLNQEFVKLESNETEIRQNLIDRVKDADWLLPERRSVILSNLKTLKGAELVSYGSLVDAIEKNSKRPAYWLDMLNDRHEAYYSAPFGSTEQAEAKRLALYFLEMHAKRQKERIRLLSDQLQAAKKAELLSSVERLHRFYLSQFNQPIVFDAAPAKHAAELEKSISEIESKREAEIQSMHSNRFDSNEDDDSGDVPAAPGARP